MKNLKESDTLRPQFSKIPAHAKHTSSRRSSLGQVMKQLTHLNSLPNQNFKEVGFFLTSLHGNVTFFCLSYIFCLIPPPSQVGAEQIQTMSPRIPLAGFSDTTERKIKPNTIIPSSQLGKCTGTKLGRFSSALGSCGLGPSLIARVTCHF